MKMAILARKKTTSGRPPHVRCLRRYRHPRSHNAFLTRASGFVFSPLIVVMRPA